MWTVKLAVPVVAVAMALASCSTEAGDDATSAVATTTPATSTAPSESAADAQQQYPDVVDAELSASGDGFTIAVTLSSPYDTPERYADGWRVMTADGDVLSEHTLGHDHANEQPFTRTSSPFEIPDGVSEIVVEGRDQEFGYGGDTVTVDVPR
ncbi:hypothetical protein [Demequina flava]|uniref:hypothetical protein n=1 Tax=Demequina flava TaxID=1095025 RepID=UPI0007843A45|nr:hypothetical protein [Demequina flava]